MTPAAPTPQDSPVVPPPVITPGGTVIVWDGQVVRHYDRTTDPTLRAITLGFLDALPTLSDREFIERVSDLLYQSANMNFRGIDAPDLDARVAAASQESRRRAVAAGHDQWCSNSLYDRAYRRAVRSVGGSDDVPTPCNCTPGEEGQA